jgi:hypothetical protein
MQTIKERQLFGLRSPLVCVPFGYSIAESMPWPVQAEALATAFGQRFLSVCWGTALTLGTVAKLELAWTPPTSKLWFMVDETHRKWVPIVRDAFAVVGLKVVGGQAHVSAIRLQIWVHR